MLTEKMNPEVFLDVAESGSFRKSAERLGYTQAGISYIIKSMEESLGLTLFLRERSGVRLSREGESLLPHFRQLASWERQLTQSVQELKGLEKGSIRVQIFDSISIHWIPGIIRKFHDDYPGIQIELVSEEDSVRAEEMVLSGEVDCGFFLTDVHANLDVVPLMEEKLLAIVAPEHPMAALPVFPVSELGNHQYISMKYDEHTGIGDIFRKRGITPDTIFCLDNDYAAMAMVSRGIGFCIFPELLLQDSPYALRCMEFDEPEKRVISIGTVSRKTCSNACRKFIEYTQRWVSEYLREKSEASGDM